MLDRLWHKAPLLTLPSRDPPTLVNDDDDEGDDFEKGKTENGVDDYMLTRVMIMMSAVMSTSFSRPSPFNDDDEKMKIITLIMVIRVILMPRGVNNDVSDEVMLI